MPSVRRPIAGKSSTPHATRGYVGAAGRSPGGDASEAIDTRPTDTGGDFAVRDTDGRSSYCYWVPQPGADELTGAEKAESADQCGQQVGAHPQEQEQEGNQLQWLLERQLDFEKKAKQRLAAELEVVARELAAAEVLLHADDVVLRTTEFLLSLTKRELKGTRDDSYRARARGAQARWEKDPRRGARLVIKALIDECAEQECQGCSKTSYQDFRRLCHERFLACSLPIEFVPTQAAFYKRMSQSRRTAQQKLSELAEARNRVE